MSKSVQGIVTVLLGVLTPLVLANTPESSPHWLSVKERKFLITRMSLQDGGAKVQQAGRHFSWGLLWEVVKDWQFYLMVGLSSTLASSMGAECAGFHETDSPRSSTTGQIRSLRMD